MNIVIKIYMKTVLHRKGNIGACLFLCLTKKPTHSQGLLFGFRVNGKKIESGSAQDKM